MNEDVIYIRISNKYSGGVYADIKIANEAAKEIYVSRSWKRIRTVLYHDMKECSAFIFARFHIDESSDRMSALAHEFEMGEHGIAFDDYLQFDATFIDVAAMQSMIS